MKEKQPRPFFAATMMSTVPYRDAAKTAEIILKSCPQAPRLPIMTRSFRWLYEGIPCLILDREKKRVFMAPPEQREAEVLEFYDRVENDDLEYFATTVNTAPFYYEILEKLQRADREDLNWVGFQIPGPNVLGATFKQIDGRPCFHHEDLWDILVKAIAMKTRWLEKMIKEALPQIQVIADHPEPTLVSFTSSEGSGSREKIIQGINQAFQGFGGLRWVHCCSNIDWTLLTEAEIDVINFDAFQFADKIALYAKEIQGFLARGGMLGWGIVPVSDDLIAQENVDSLMARLDKGIDLLVQQGVDEELLYTSSWVLTACETSLLSPQQADVAFDLNEKISARMRLRGADKAGG